MMFTEIWHNKNPFNIVFTREEGKKNVKMRKLLSKIPTRAPYLYTPRFGSEAHGEIYTSTIKSMKEET